MYKKLALWVVASLLGTGIANAAPIMYVHDANGVLAKVDVVTGDVDLIGNMGVQMTDIAFDPSGNLFGISFGGLYGIDATTATPTFLGSHGIAGGNALVFGADGTLYAAGGTPNLYTLNTGTGASTNLGATGFASGGDLAFFNGQLYLANASSDLVHIDLANLANSSLIGDFGFASVFGLATGDNNVLYGVGGTQIFTVDVSTGAGSNAVNYAGQGLGQAFGQSFYTESGAPPPVPEPATLVLLGSAVVSWSAYHRRRRR